MTENALYIVRERESSTRGASTTESVRLKVFCRDRLTLNATSAERVWYRVVACLIAPRTAVKVAIAEIVMNLCFTIETVLARFAESVLCIVKARPRDAVGASVAERER